MDRSCTVYCTLHLDLRGSRMDHVWRELRKLKFAAVKARSGVLHCGCGRATLEIKREGIMFKQRDVLCRSRRHRWMDEVISFSCMICNPADQENCIGGEEKDRVKKRAKPSFSLHSTLWLFSLTCNHSDGPVPMKNKKRIQRCVQRQRARLEKRWLRDIWIKLAQDP